MWEAFADEMEKIALSSKLLQRALEKSEAKRLRLFQLPRTRKRYERLSRKFQAGYEKARKREFGKQQDEAIKEFVQGTIRLPLEAAKKVVGR
jgi:hypothetical protein